MPTWPSQPLLAQEETVPYPFQPGKMYRMPTHFGPRTGPRQGEDGRKFENKDTPKTTTIAVSFLTNAEQLEELLPEGFELAGEPVVTVAASYMTEIEWLAGRGYNTLGVSFPAPFQGRTRPRDRQFFDRALGESGRPDHHRARGAGFLQDLLRAARAGRFPRRIALDRQLDGLQIPRRHGQ